MDELASDDLVLSYPVIQTIFGKPALRGRDEVRGFAERFCARWTDAELQVHDALADGDRVVLVWSFSATPAVGDGTTPRSSWGGITLFRFDRAGQITHEIGEESEPGPMGRLGGPGSE